MKRRKKEFLTPQFPTNKEHIPGNLKWQLWYEVSIGTRLEILIVVEALASKESTR